MEKNHTGEMNDMLVLRQLSTMTNEEEKVAYKLEFKTERKEEELQQYFWSVECWLPETITYLLKSGFDLFGLIESGQAIDKQKVKQ